MTFYTVCVKTHVRILFSQKHAENAGLSGLWTSDQKVGEGYQCLGHKKEVSSPQDTTTTGRPKDTEMYPFL